MGAAPIIALQLRQERLHRATNFFQNEATKRGRIALRSCLKFALATAALVSVAAPSIAAEPLAVDAKAFGTRDNINSMAMSPDGSHLAMLASGPNATTVLQTVDIATGKVLSLTKTDGRPETLRWCTFAGNRNLVCSYDGVVPYENVLVGMSRLITIGVDGTGMKELGQKASQNDAYLRQYDGGVIDMSPGREGSVLLQREYIPEINTTGSILGRAKEGMGVDLVDLTTLKFSTIEKPRSGADSYMSDGRGNVRLYTFHDKAGDSQLTGRMMVKYRKTGSSDWADLGTYDDSTGEGIYPLAIDADTDSLYALRKMNSRDALVRIKLDGSKAEAVVASNPQVDIDNVIRLGSGQRVIGYTFADERRHHVYFDPEFSKLQSSLAKALPNQPLVDFLGGSADGTKVLVYASGDIVPGAFYRFDRTTKKLESIAPVRPLLANRALAKVTAIRYPAADGTSIPAYLTMPAGSSGKNLPAVVLPHGGPSARDEWGFDWLPQFLATRGYAVIQPNYRGSAGYGDEWLMKNGFKSWRTSIGDITASAKYLVAQGIADPNRLAIVGWSYGGYAALQSAAVEPSLYKAVAAVAPVTDLAMLRAEFKDFTNARLASAFIGEGPHLVEGSPLRNASKIKIPVLLVHGDRDANVAIAESEAMEDALQKSGTSVEFVRFSGLDHQLDDSAARTEMLTKIGSLLERAIGN